MWPYHPSNSHRKEVFLFFLIDDYLRYMWIILVRPKDEGFEAFKKVKATTVMEHKLMVQALRTYHDGEFMSG